MFWLHRQLCRVSVSPHTVVMLQLSQATECMTTHNIAHSEDLWAALEETSKKPVTTVMNTWTKQMGYPVLTVEGKQVSVVIAKSPSLSQR